jgi:hypothetical protein
MRVLSSWETRFTPQRFPRRGGRRHRRPRRRQSPQAMTRPSENWFWNEWRQSDPKRQFALDARRVCWKAQAFRPPGRRQFPQARCLHEPHIRELVSEPAGSSPTRPGRSACLAHQPPFVGSRLLVPEPVDSFNRELVPEPVDSARTPSALFLLNREGSKPKYCDASWPLCARHLI